MRKALAVILTLAVVAGITGCAGSTSVSSTSSTSSAAPAAPVPQSSQPAETKETDYPVRPVNNIIPYAAGGGTDVWNRKLMEAMTPYLGQNIVCSNMTGGVGSVGIGYVWESRHDGYTLCANSETSLTVGVMTGFEKTSKDWEYYIAAGSPGLLCINKNSKYKTMEDCIEALKAEPGSVTIAGTVGGLWYCLAELFNSYGNVPFKFVSYDGSATALKGCVSNETDCVMLSAGEARDYVRSGDLIPLCVMNTVDWEFPEYGTVSAATSFCPELEKYLPLGQYLAFMVPKDTDEAIKKKLEDAFLQAMESDTIKSFAEEQLAEIFCLTGQAASDHAADMESKLCWCLFEMGQTTYSPEDLGIPKP